MQMVAGGCKRDRKGNLLPSIIYDPPEHLNPHCLFACALHCAGEVVTEEDIQALRAAVQPFDAPADKPSPGGD
eukprot:5674990-Amphidinium_carterae.1